MILPVFLACLVTQSSSSVVQRALQLRRRISLSNSREIPEAILDAPPRADPVVISTDSLCSRLARLTLGCDHRDITAVNDDEISEAVPLPPDIDGALMPVAKECKRSCARYLTVEEAALDMLGGAACKVMTFIRVTCPLNALVTCSMLRSLLKSDIDILRHSCNVANYVVYTEITLLLFYIFRHEPIRPMLYDITLHPRRFGDKLGSLVWCCLCTTLFLAEAKLYLVYY